MKIVGKTDKGYLCQVSETEIGIVTGYGKYPTYGDRKDDFYRATGRARGEHSIPTDTEIAVVEMHSYIRELRSKQQKAKQLAHTLVELAEMITSGLPEVSIVPSSPAEMGEEE